MSLMSPYKETYQYTRIKIEPHYFNADIRNNMEHILKQKIEKKCNKNGYVDEIYEIVEYSDGIMVPENLSGGAVFNIKYHCRLCYPIINSIIIAQVRKITYELIICINGPLYIFIPKEKIDQSYWNISDNFKNKINGKHLELNMYVQVLIIDKRINQHDKKIKAEGKMMNIASEEEIRKYYGNTIIIEEKESNFI